MTDRKQHLPISDIPYLKEPKVECITLDNGIKVLMLNSGDEGVTRITFSWQGGQYESTAPAASYLLTKLLKDSNPDLSANGMADLLDSCGAWVTSELKSHYMALSLFTINSQLHNVLPAIIDTINRPVFPEAETELLKTQSASRFELISKKVTFLAQELENGRIFGKGHPASLTPRPDDYLKVSVSDLQMQYATMYQGQAPVVYIAGKIDESVRALILCELSRINTVNELTTPLDLRPFSPGKPGIERIDKPDSLQSALLITMPAIPRKHPDYEKLRAVVIALGGYFGSRLMTTIREEKGLTYGISAALLGHREGSFITISSQCDNSYTELVIREVLNEIHRLATEPMTQSELTTLKRYIRSILAATFDTPFSAMDYFTAHRHIGTPLDYLHRQQYALEQLTPETIMQLASEYLDKPAKYISVAGKITSKK
ncbi:MAG: insulinase family protein [Muribaculaceae bacterium]|nr:insulinase family protein [Muribaculaceae bacterium]